MSIDMREVMEHRYNAYKEYERKAEEAKANGQKELAETMERASAKAYGEYRSAKDCI